MGKLPTFKPSRASTIRGYDPKVGAAIEERDVRRVVARLGFGHLDPASKESRVGSAGTARLDRQKNMSSGGANLQVQLNDPEDHGIDARAGTTVAQLVVPADVFTVARDCHEPNVQAGLVRAARSGLLRSLAANGVAFTIVVI